VKKRRRRPQGGRARPAAPAPAPPGAAPRAAALAAPSPSPRAALLLYACLAVSVALLFATPLATTPMLFGVVGIAALLVAAERRTLSLRREAGVAAGLAGGFLAAALLVAPRALDPAGHLLTAAEIALYLALAPFLFRAGTLASRHLPLSAGFGPLALATIAAALLLAAEAASSGLRAPLLGWTDANTAVERINRPTEYVVILSLFLVAVARARGDWRLAAALLLPIVALAVVTESDTAKLLVLLGGPAALLPLPFQRFAAALACLLFLLVGLLGFTGFYAFALQAAEAQGLTDFKPLTIAARLDIWEKVASVLQASGGGLGIEATRALSATVDFSGAHYADPRLWHPHNGPLQLLLDLGAAGALWFALAALSVLRALWRRSDAVASGACAAVVAGLLETLFAHGLWQSWWWATVLILVFLSGWRDDQAPARPSRSAR